MPIVNIPGAGLVRFPDDMSDADIGVAIRQDVLPTVQKSGFGAGVSGGIESLKGAALAAKYGLTGSEADRQAVLESQAKAAEKYQGVGYEDVAEAFKERGIMAGLGRTWEAAKGTLGQSLPFMAAPVAGAALAPAAIPAGIAGLSAGAIGFAAPSIAQYTGTGLARQVEEQEAALKRGETPQELSVGKAALASIPATVLDRFALGKTFKGTGLGRLFGEEGKDAAETIAKKIVDTGADPSKFKSILAGGARGIAAEIPNEVGQQILERAQAGLSLTDDQAIREYKEAAFGATLLGGPLGGASGMGLRGAGMRTAAEWEQRAVDETAAYTKKEAERLKAMETTKTSILDGIRAANEREAARVGWQGDIQEVGSAALDRSLQLFDTPEGIDTILGGMNEYFPGTPAAELKKIGIQLRTYKNRLTTQIKEDARKAGESAFTQQTPDLFGEYRVDSTLAPAAVEQPAPAFELGQQMPIPVQGELELTTPENVITPDYLKRYGVRSNTAVFKSLSGLDLGRAEDVAKARQVIEDALTSEKLSTKTQATLDTLARKESRLQDQGELFNTAELEKLQIDRDKALADEARSRRNEGLINLLADLERENAANEAAVQAEQHPDLGAGVTEDITQVPFTGQLAPAQAPVIEAAPSPSVPSEVRPEDTAGGLEPSVGVDGEPSGVSAPADTGVGGEPLRAVGEPVERPVEAPETVGGPVDQTGINHILAGLRKEGLTREEARQQVAEATPEDLAVMQRLYAPVQAATKTTAEQESEIAEAAQTEGEFGDISARNVQAAAQTEGVPLEEAKQIVARLMRGWNRDVIVRVVNRNNLPEGFQQRLLNQGLLGAKGFIDENGAVWIIANNNTDAADITATMFHETLGHLGLRLKFGQELSGMMNQFYNTNAELKRLANQWLNVHRGEYSADLTPAEQQAKAVEEVLAERAEAGRLPASVMDKIKALINKWARKAGIKVSFSDAEIRAILDQAQQEVVQKTGAAKTAPAELAPRVAATTPEELFTQAGGFAPTPAIDRAKSKIQNTIDSFSSMEKIVDKINDTRTQIFSADTKFNARLRKALQDAGLDWKELMLTASSSQALHRGGLAERFLEWGTLTYNDADNRWDSKKDDVNIITMGTKIREMADAMGKDPVTVKGWVGEAWVAKRLQNIQQEIAALEKEIDAFSAPKTKGARQYQSSRTEKLELLQRVAELRTPEQLASGLALYDALGADNMKALDTMKNTMRKRVLDMMVDTGVMTKDMAETFLENAEWVPFYRVTNEDETIGGPAVLSKGLSEQMKEKKLKGATGVDDKKQVSGVDNLVKWLDWSVRRAVSNKQKQVMVDLFKSHVANEVHEGKGETGYTISVMEDGQEKFYHFDDPMIAQAFTGMLPVMVPGMKGWRAATEGLRKAITRFPLFPVAQIVQDTYDAMFTSGLKHPTKVLTGVLKEIFRTYKGTSTARETLLGRGILSRDYSAAAEQEAAEVLAGLKDQNWFQRLNFNLEKFSSTADHIVRQAVYNQAKAEGLSEREAVEKATEIINFRRQGAATWVNWMRTMVPFFGAYLQVQNVALKTLSGEGISPTERKAALATLAMTAAKVGLFGMLYSMAMGDDDEYKEMDRRTRDRMILIPGTSVGIAIRPNVFATPKIFAEHAYGYLTDNGTTDGTKIRAAAKAALVDSVLPSSYAVPQLVRPALEVAMDHNIFLDRPIVGNLKNLEKYEQFTSSTSELAKLLGASPLSPWSPVQWDHLIRGYTSSVGSVLTLATNDAIAAAAGRPRPDKSWQDTINAIPNMGNFVVKEFGTGDKTDFYELAGEVAKVNNTVNRLEAQGRGEEIEGYLTEEKQQLLALKKPVANIQKQLAAIRKQKNAVLQSTEMSAAEKADAMRELNKAEQDVVKGRTAELRRAAGF